MSGYMPNPERRKRLPPWQHARKPIDKKGKVGKAQDAFNKRTMAGWRFRYGVCLCSAVSGLTGQLVVGHIEDRSLEPSLRTVASNVAPITWYENEAMKTDYGLRRKYQKLMREWVERDQEKRRQRT